MRRLLLLWSLAAPAWAGYSFQRTVNLQAAQIVASQTNFTVLVCANATLGNAATCPTVTGLNQSGGGAAVQNASGFDIVFSSTACAAPTLLKWEMAKYVAASGAMVAWVLIPALSSSGNTIYLCYGNSGISTFQGGAAGANWDASTLVSYHMEDNAATTTIVDSTANANNATNSVNTSTKTATGQIASGLTYTAASINVATSNAGITLGSTATLECWTKPASITANYARLLETHFANSYFLGTNTGHAKYNFIVNNNGGSFEAIIGGTIDTNWHHVVGMYDGTNAYLFVDGVQVATHAETAPASASKTLYIAREDDASAGYWDGVIDEIRVANTNRPASWITTVFNNESAPSSFETFGAQQGTTANGGYMVLN